MESSIILYNWMVCFGSTVVLDHEYGPLSQYDMSGCGYRPQNICKRACFQELAILYTIPCTVYIHAIR